MDNAETSPAEERAEKNVRPVLMVSERTMCEYSAALQQLLTGLTEESIPVVLVCRPECGVDSVLAPLVEVIRYPTFDLPFLARQNLKVLAERLDKFQPTVLHCLCQSRGALAAQVAAQMDVPYVLTANALPRRWGALSIHWSHCAQVMAPARTIAGTLRCLHPRHADRITQVNTGTFADDSTGCFLEPGGLVSMVVARPLNRAREFEPLFKAVKRLVIDGYEFILIVMGDGRAESHVRKMLRDLGLLWVVTLVPMLKPWRSVLAAGDIYIQPRPAAAFDPILLEAMSAGTAVAACTGGVDDLIIDGQTSVVFDPDDELSIYGTLQRLFDRPEFARQIAAGAQQHVRENHSVSRMVADTLRAYSDAPLWYANARQSLPAAAV